MPTCSARQVSHLPEVIDVPAPDCPPDHHGHDDMQRALKLPLDQAHSDSTGAHILQVVRRLGSQVSERHHELQGKTYLSHEHVFSSAAPPSWQYTMMATVIGVLLYRMPSTFVPRDARRFAVLCPSVVVRCNLSYSVTETILWIGKAAQPLRRKAALW